MKNKLDIIVAIALIVSMVAQIILWILGIDLEAQSGLQLALCVDRTMSMGLGYLLCIVCRDEMTVSRKTEG